MISPSAISPLNRKVVDVAFTGLLDDYSGAAAAYSVRRLSSTYTGALMEVRRTVSSTTVTANVAYDSNNELSFDSEITVTGGSSSATNLGEFVAATGYSDPDSLGSGQDSFVRTWYDQSGNSNDAQQTTTSNQPQIVSSGSVLTVSDKPVLDFDGTDDVIGSNLSSFNITLFANLANIKTYTVPTIGSTVLSSENSDDKRYFFINTFTSEIRNGGTTLAKYNYFSNPYIISIIFKSTAFVDVFENGGSVSTKAVSGSSNTSQIGIGGSLALSRAMDMALSEAIFWGDESTTRQSGVHANQNTYYSIY